MNHNNLTIKETLEIFADYLDSISDMEVVQTRKMGWLLVEDPSSEKTRSDLVVEQIKDGNHLADMLFSSEMYDAYFSITHAKVDPKNCDATVKNRVREMMQRRLSRLPAGFDKAIENFFGDAE